MTDSRQQTIQRRGPRNKSSTMVSPDYSAIVAGLYRNDSGAYEHLDQVFRGGVEFFLRRSGVSISSLGGLADECFEQVRAQIVQGVLRSPAELPKLVRNTLADMIRPTYLPANSQEAERGRRVLAQMSKRGVEALRAHFVAGETPAAIFDRLNVTQQTLEQYKAEAKFLFRTVFVETPTQELKIG